MTGEIIRFEKLRNSRRGPPCADPAFPRGPFAPEPPVAGHDLQSLERQLARIAGLLEELESLTRTSTNIPPATRQRALILTQKARALVQPSSQHGPAEPDDIEGDPQPAIDNERVERMYRDLNSDR